MSNNQVATIKEQVKSVGQVLEQMKPQLQAALPKHITPERLMRVALTAIQNTPKLLECDRNSLFRAILTSAQLGLEPDGILGQAYLIPFGKQVQFIPGYKGLIDLARRSGEVLNIIAKEVCEKDNFKIQWHEEVPFVHEQATSGDRGAVIGFWAMAKFKDGGFHFDYMTKEEVEKIRDGSSGYQAAKKWAKEGKIESPWTNNFVEMGKKTVIRRIAKFLPLSVQKAAVLENQADAGRSVNLDDTGEITIDGEFTSQGVEGSEAETTQGDATKKQDKLAAFEGEDSFPGDKK